ncbi:MAG TPA: glycosyltransferase family 2 protein [Candidatus Methanoperedenaceae archaeon]|nr:glycosyltransferase family 2 protein [Candidatus Methanoperedenaceae archaeon]
MAEPVTVILPALNEEVAIGSMVLRARRFVQHVLVIDDGSRDHTSEVAELAGAEVIRHPKNMGKGAALRTGFEAAVRGGAKVIVTLDADGQHDPADIPRLVAPILSGEADMVNGSRYVNGNGNSTPAYRRLGQAILDKATNLNAGLHITDTQSGFRAFAADSAHVFRFRANGLAIESEMLSDAAAAGLRVKEVEIGVRYDVEGSTEHPLRHGLKVLVNVLHDMELRRPLYYFTVPGILMAGVGVFMGLDFLRDFYLGKGLMFGPTLLMILLTLVGTFMAFTGLILHTMAKLIAQMKQ